METFVHVSIGEVKVGSGNTVLKANLGSCVGIAFLWKSRGVFGLAHCFLPATEDAFSLPTARYVNHAVPSLVDLMKIPKACFHEITVVIAGGSLMMANPMKSMPGVGQLNTKATREILKQSGFHISREETGGELGRQILVHCSISECKIVELQKLD